MDYERLVESIIDGAGFDQEEIEAFRKARLNDKKLSAEAVAREQRIVRDALDNAKGRIFLHWLMRQTLLSPPSQAELDATSVEAVALTARRRQGENQVVLTILSALAGSEEGETDAQG